MTMIALLASASLVCAGPANPYVVFGIVMVGLPVSMMLVAISSPKEGTSLNVRSRWYFFLLGKTWCFTIAFWILAILVMSFGASFTPGLSNRFYRMSQGDYRARVVYVTAELEDLTLAELNKAVMPLFDERGQIGECRGIYEQDVWNNATGTTYRITRMKVTTDRKDLREDSKFVVRRSGSKIYLTESSPK